MLFQWMHHFDVIVALLSVVPPRFQFGNRWNDKAEMVERLCIARADVPSMKRKVVASRRKVRVVHVGLPYELHSKHAPVEFACALDVGNSERKMAEAAMGN